jgi:hypothetical protein
MKAPKVKIIKRKYKGKRDEKYRKTKLKLLKDGTILIFE